MATVVVGVVSQAETAASALEQNNKSMQSVMDVLEKHGIAKKDIQTSGLNVSPVYNHNQERTRDRPEVEIVAYRVQNQVRLRVRKLPELGKILDALVKAGSNQISGISFGVDDETGLLNQARSRAVRDAKSRADVLAQAAGVGVGPVRQISETSFMIPQPHHMEMSFQAMDRAAQIPIATGEQEFQVTVQVVFALKSENATAE
jgi:uncharacterized protein YggE